METKVFHLIGISHDEAESMGRSPCHCRQVGAVSLSSSASFLGLHPLFFLCFVPFQVSEGYTWVHLQPSSSETPKTQNHCSHPLIHSSFFPPPVEPTSTFSSISFFPPGPQVSCSPSQIISCPKTINFYATINPPTVTAERLHYSNFHTRSDSKH